MTRSSEDAAWQEKVSDSGAALMNGLAALELAIRRLHPPEIDGLRASLSPFLEPLAAARGSLEAMIPPEGLSELHRHWLEVLALGGRALELFVDPAPPEAVAPRMLECMKIHARAQEALFQLRRVFPPISDYFFEPAARVRASTLAPDPEPTNVGIQVAGDPEGRGGFHLYVPESYDDGQDWPLVVALHGGFGHGRDFLWTWLREARSRRFLLLAPTSRDTTWSLHGQDLDGPALASMIDWIAERWKVDRGRILLTGLSDGATFTLLAGLGAEVPYTALAPVSGVLHPANFTNGNLERAAGRRIYLVHGAQDWMFPVSLAREARDMLERNGAEVTYREIEDLSHTYPREENARILEWFDPGLALE